MITVSQRSADLRIKLTQDTTETNPTGLSRINPLFKAAWLSHSRSLIAEQCKVNTKQNFFSPYPFLSSAAWALQHAFHSAVSCCILFSARGHVMLCECSIYLKDEPVIMQWVRESGLCTILLLKVPLTRPKDYSGHILSRHYSWNAPCFKCFCH